MQCYETTNKRSSDDNRPGERLLDRKLKLKSRKTESHQLSNEQKTCRATSSSRVRFNSGQISFKTHEDFSRAHSNKTRLKRQNQGETGRSCMTSLKSTIYRVISSLISLANASRLGTSASSLGVTSRPLQAENVQKKHQARHKHSHKCQHTRAPSHKEYAAAVIARSEMKCGLFNDPFDYYEGRS